VSDPNQTDLEKTLPPTKLDQFLLAVDQFNQGRYLECHETFEDVWRVQAEPHRKVTQGIIQFAVGLHHLENENKLGAAKLFKRALHHLAPFHEHATGINVKHLCQHINTILEQTDSDAKRQTDKLEKIQIELTDKLFQET
jgi:predicted metal-dependent hydrolase